MTIAYDANDRAASVAVPGHTTYYTWSLSGATLTSTASDAIGTFRTTTADTAKHVILTEIDGLNNQTTYTHDSYGRLTSVTHPAGDKVQFTYDTRGNVTETRLKSKAAGVPDVVTTASFPSSCSNLATCNKPVWTKDALGNQTDYIYNAATGQLLTETLPAPTLGGVRPKTTYAYASRQAYYKNSAGAIVASGQPISVLASVSSCLSAASCTGTADQAKTTISYGVQTTGTANNLLPVSVTRSSGNNGVVATTALDYDNIGNLISVDGPLSGAGDTTAYRYDALRRRIGVIGPDPDGTGARKNAASRITYDAKGRVTLVEQGYTSGQTTAAGDPQKPVAFGRL